MIYPVDLTKKWVLYNTKTKEAEKKNIDWPRPDGGEIIGLDPSYRYLEYYVGPKPELKEGEILVKNEKAHLSEDRYVISYTKEAIEKSAEEIFQDKIAAGYVVQPEGYTLALEEKDQNAFTRLLTLLNTAGAPNEMPTEITDKDGVIHSVTVGKLKQILVQYGLYYQRIWAEYKKSQSQNQPS